MYESLVFAIAGASSIVGVISGYLFNGKKIKDFFSKRQLKKIDSNKKNKTNDENVQELEGIFKTEKELKEELKIFQYEKSLISYSINKILEEYRNKEIDIYERDRLLRKYRQELDEYDEKILEIQSKLDLTSLMNLRQNLMNVVENRVVEIDDKIKEINNKLGSEYTYNNTKNFIQKNESKKTKKKDEDDEKDLVKNKIHEKKDLVENNEIKKLRNEVANALKDLDTNSGTKIGQDHKDGKIIVSDIIENTKNNENNDGISKKDDEKTISILWNQNKNESKIIKEEKEKTSDKSTQYPLSNILSTKNKKSDGNVYENNKLQPDENSKKNNNKISRDSLNRIR